MPRAVVAIPWWALPFVALWAIVVGLFVGLWRLSAWIVKASARLYIRAARDLGRVSREVRK